jgi:Arc/MetJ-type ribon-helix-helix transcriptional regulator
MVQPSLIRRIDAAVAGGEYESRSHAVRVAIRNLLAERQKAPAA